MKAGFTAEKKQRYRCRFTACDKSHFLLDYSYRACLPGVKKQVLDMAINGSGIRDTARVLNIPRTTILNTLKKKEKNLVQVNPDFFNHHSKNRGKSQSRAGLQ